MQKETLIYNVENKNHFSMGKNALIVKYCSTYKIKNAVNVKIKIILNSRLYIA